MEMPDNILEKVQALLRLAASGSGATEAEASLAMERAQALLLKYNLEMADIDLQENGNGSRLEVLDDYFNIGHSSWRKALLAVIAKQNFCRVVLVGGSNPHIIGRKYNIEVVQEMSLWLAGQLDSLVMADIGAREFLGQTVDCAWKDSFLYGALNRIKERLIEAKNNYDGQTQALVVCLDEKTDAFVREAYPRLRSVSHSILNSKAYSAGVSAGNTVSIIPSRRQVR